MSRVSSVCRSKTARVAATILLVAICSVPTMASPLILGAQTFYRLLAVPLVDEEESLLPSFGVDVSLNPCPLPPGGQPNPGTSLDLSQPGSPLYTQPDFGGDWTEIDWGMNFGSDIAFSFPGPQPGDPNFVGNAFSFMAQANGPNGLFGDQFLISMQIGGTNAGDLVALNPCPLPPGQFPSEPTQGFQFNFNIQGDPMLSFQLHNITQDVDYIFVPAADPVPEPGTLLLAGGGLLTGCRWLKRRATRP